MPFALVGMTSALKLMGLTGRGHGDPERRNIDSDRVKKNCDFSLFPLFFHQIISGRALVFGGNPRLLHYAGPK
jgi:hypothetical protein